MGLRVVGGAGVPVRMRMRVALRMCVVVSGERVGKRRLLRVAAAGVGVGVDTGVAGSRARVGVSRH